ncbi:MAG: hypothetical protein AAFO98_00315 [Pseudomonadota bacterium]
MSECGHPKMKDDQDIEDLHFDETERFVLSLIRQFCLAYTQSPHPLWECAFDFACHNKGPKEGPAIAYAVLNVMRTMREARKSTFRYNNPGCSCCRKRVSNCERLLLNAFHLTRHGDRSSAQMELLMLCEGHDTRSVLTAMEQLTSLVGSLGFSDHQASQSKNAVYH